MHKKYFLPIFLFLQIILLQILKFFPEFVERFYSNGLYQIISKTERFLFGKIPFSVGDCIYTILIICILYWFFIQRKTWKSNWKNNVLKILSCLSVFYFLFHTLWAFNYYRQPLFEKMKIEREYSDADLLIFTKKLIQKTNQVQFQITKNDSIKVDFPYSQKQAFAMSLNGYVNLSKQYNYFTYNHLSVKKSLFSLPLSYMGFGGYLNPFTNEAQVNDLMPMYNFPATTCHEIAHQIGFASENECNFIGFLATINNDDFYFQYAGYCTALKYCMNNLAVKNPMVYENLKAEIHIGILKNYQESEDFHKKYDTIIDDGFHAFYDQFLKSNQQKDGIESYSKVVDLLVNYYKMRRVVELH